MPAITTHGCGPRSAQAAALAPMHLDLSEAALARRADGVSIALAPRDAALLAWLALEGPTTRTRLAGLLWPASEPGVARNTLRQRLFRLKQQCGDLVIGTAALRLANGVEHDLADARSVLGALQFGDAPELDAWLLARRQSHESKVRQGLERQAQALEEAGELGDALPVAQALLRLEPLSEAAHRRVMRLHYLRGDRSAALLAFDHCEQVLKDEVGAKPSAETLALLQTIEAADAASSTLGARLAGPASVLRPPRLVGRTAELGAALRAWHSDRIFCLEGEAGMGKSRLLQEIAARRPDAVCAQARPGDAVVPYVTLVRLLRALLACTPLQGLDAAVQHSLARLLPELGASTRLPIGADAGQRLALDRAVADMVRAARAAGIGAVIVDDLHFADDASLEMLLQLSRGAGDQALNWGFARRPAEGSSALAELNRALLEEQRLEPVPLAPLTREQLAELLGSLGLPHVPVAELAVSLHQHSGGNPLFALETLRHAWADIGADLAGGRLPRPTSVTRLIESRVMRLSPAAVRLARCAAVAGADFSIDLAAVVLVVPAIDLADAWSELEQAHVLVDGAFAHDLIQEAVQAGVPQPIARHLHGEVADHLERSAGAPASIATHWLAAGEPVRSLPFLHRAGELAAAQRRFGEAATAFEREARLRLEQGDAQGAFAAALCMREACFEVDLAGRTDTALEVLERAATTPQQQASACAERAVVCLTRLAMTDAERAVMVGLEKLDGLPEPGLRSQLHQHLAAVRLWQHRPAEAHELLRSIERDVEASGNAVRRIEFAEGMAGVHEHLDRPSETVHWYRRAADTALAAGELPRAAQSLLDHAAGWLDIGRIDRALAGLEEAQALLASLPEGTTPYSTLDVNFAIVLRTVGRYGEALDRLDRAIERGRAHLPGWVPLFLCHRARTWLVLGQFARAQQDLDAAQVEGAPPKYQAFREMILAQLLGMLGQDSAPAFERAASQLGQGAPALSLQRLALARCSVLEPAEALAVAGEVLDLATAVQRVGLMVAARTRLCQAALALGDVGEAACHARQLATLTDSVCSDGVYRPEVWLTAQRALARTDPQSAAAVLATAMNWLHETARNRVPGPFRNSFLQRNPVNLELLALARSACH